MAFVPGQSKTVCLGFSDETYAGPKALTQGYQTFKTANTDGWQATQNAWKKLFPSISLILCFWHAFLRIKERCRRYPDPLNLIGQKVWHAYHAPTKAHFPQRIRRLREWGKRHLSGTVEEKVLSLCDKSPHCKIAFDFPTAHRTSNALDRLMDYQDRLLYSMQYLHGSQQSARLYVRSMALFWNFHPYHPQTQLKYQGQASSPFEGLNGFCYLDIWLHNLLIASSLLGQSLHPQNPV